MVPDWIWFVFIFAFGCCIGSFLNVVIYRLPRDRSLIRPASACPECGEHIRFYDNIPLISWLLLGCKCRYCKTAISPRYFVIELLTGSVFAGLFYVYFYTDLRSGMPVFLQGGWFIYLFSIILLAVLIAASAIDLELWVIPLSICWFGTIVGLAGSAIGAYIIDIEAIDKYALLPLASAKTAALAVGAVIGLAISMILLAAGVIKRSYEAEGRKQETEDGRQEAGDSRQEAGDRRQEAEDRIQEAGDGIQEIEDGRQETEDGSEHEQENFNHRLEVWKEVVFLLPIVICSAAAYRIFQNNLSIRGWWSDFSQIPAIAGLLGSLWGYFVGCGVVWATRIFGTLGFGKEAMGLGDVHLMGAAGAVIGPIFVVAAFFIAPFFGLAWAGFQMFFKKIRQIPYGPFLSLGIFTVIIFHDRILDYLKFVFSL